MAMIQLDLFEIAEENEREVAFAAGRKDPGLLAVGDVLHVIWGNGVEWEGAYCGLKGFWDGREEFKDNLWIHATRVRHVLDGKDAWSDASAWKMTNPKRDKWTVLRHDSSFQMPRKEDVLPLLMDELKAVPFEKRLPVFRSIEQRYPYLSYEWGWRQENVLGSAWNVAIIATTTLDELLESEKAANGVKIPKAVADYIKSWVFTRDRAEWMQALLKIHWSEAGWKDSRDQKNWWVYRFENQPLTVYKELLLHNLAKARSASELVKLAAIWGAKHDSTQVQPKKFWVEEA